MVIILLAFYRLYNDYYGKGTFTMEKFLEMNNEILKLIIKPISEVYLKFFWTMY
jgi:hypothetical protein